MAAALFFLGYSISFFNLLAYPFTPHVLAAHHCSPFITRMHLSPLWRTALLSASHTLRQEQGDWEDGEDIGTNGNDKISKPMSTSSSPTDQTFDFSSNAAANLPSTLSRSSGDRRYRTFGRSTGRAACVNGKGKGRVRGLVESWERSGSESEADEVSGHDLMSGEGPNYGGMVEASAGGVQAPPMSKSTSESSAADYVTAPSTPASASFTSMSHPASGSEDETSEASASESVSTEAAVIPVSRSTSTHSSSSTSSAAARVSEGGPEDEGDTDRNEGRKEEEGPSIETLLTRSWGAGAWEALDAGETKGITVKRVPVIAGVGVHANVGGNVGGIGLEDGDEEVGGKGVVGWEDEDTDLVADDDGSLPLTVKHISSAQGEDQQNRRIDKRGSVRGIGSGSGREREKRVVTAIFTAEPQYETETVSRPISISAVAEGTDGAEPNPIPIVFGSAGGPTGEVQSVQAEELHPVENGPWVAVDPEAHARVEQEEMIIRQAEAELKAELSSREN